MHNYRTLHNTHWTSWRKNLDSKTTKEIMEMFHQLHQQGNTIVLITHDNDIAKQAARVIHILDGKISEVSL